MSTESLKIFPDTKSRLDNHKKKYGSYDKIISAFLDYFEVTGIKPHEVQSSPIAIVKSRADATISLMRGIEKKAVKRDQETHSFLEAIYEKLDSQNGGAYTEEEGQIFLQNINKLESDIKEKEAEIRKLKQQILNNNDSQKSDLSPKISDNYSEIRNQINLINESKTTSRVKDNHYQISKNIYTSAYESIMNLTK